MASQDKPAVQPLVVPHLVVDDAAAAIDFYVKAFGARSTAGCHIRTAARTPRSRSTGRRSCSTTTSPISTTASR
jgi:hypothetical protein